MYIFLISGQLAKRLKCSPEGTQWRFQCRWGSSLRTNCSLFKKLIIKMEDDRLAVWRETLSVLIWSEVLACARRSVWEGLARWRAGRGSAEAGSPWASALPAVVCPLGSHRSSVRSSLNSRPCEPEKSGQDWPAPLYTKSSEKDFLQNLQFAPGSSPGRDPGPVLLSGAHSHSC